MRHMVWVFAFAALLLFSFGQAKALAASSLSSLTFLAADTKTLVTLQCLDADGTPGYWSHVPDGVVDRESYIATSLVPARLSSVVQCIDTGSPRPQAAPGTIDGDMPPADIVKPGSYVTYVDTVTVALPRTIHNLNVGGESVHIRSSQRGVILALTGFIQVFPASAVLDLSIRSSVAIDRTGRGPIEPLGGATCHVAYIGEDGKTSKVVTATKSCADLFYADDDGSALFSRSL